jgi:peptidoglycan/LPS O-acetylase OafA/YrhL
MGSGAAREGTRRLDSLTSLRWFAAALVMGFHASGLLAREHLGPVYQALQSGPAAVSFFFILSGFVLTWSYQPGQRLGAFWRNRAARIYPAHIATWLLMVPVLAAQGAPHGGRIGGLSLLLVQAWIPVFKYFFAFNLVTWSLSCEVFFYLCFPLLHRWMAKVKKRTPLMIGMLAVSVTVPALLSASHSIQSFWLVDVFPPLRLLEFCVGIALAMEVRAGRWRRVPLGPMLVATVVLLPVVQHFPFNMRFAAVTVVPFTLLVAAAATADIDGRWSPLRGRVLVRLGELSFSLYLVHTPVMQGIVAITHYRAGNRLGDFLFWLGLVAASLVGMWLLHTLVEHPFQRVLRAPRTTGSAVPERPIVGDLGRERILPEDLVGAVREGRAVGDEGGGAALALEPVPDEGRNGHQHIIELPDVHLDKVAAGR